MGKGGLGASVGFRENARKGKEKKEPSAPKRFLKEKSSERRGRRGTAEGMDNGDRLNRPASFWKGGRGWQN